VIELLFAELNLWSLRLATSSVASAADLFAAIPVNA
jgi:hypothetical protein